MNFFNFYSSVKKLLAYFLLTPCIMTKYFTAYIQLKSVFHQ